MQRILSTSVISIITVIGHIGKLYTARYDRKLIALNPSTTKRRSQAIIGNFRCNVCGLIVSHASYYLGYLIVTLRLSILKQHSPISVRFYNIISNRSIIFQMKKSNETFH